MRHLTLSALVCLSLVILVFADADRPQLPELKTPDFTGALRVPVERIIDGDTIVVLMEGDAVRVRLIGVSAPEHDAASTMFLTNLLKGEEVWLLSETDELAKDKYDRLLAYVHRVPDGLFVNAELIRQGYAQVFQHIPFRQKVPFAALEAFAKTAGKGVWSDRAADEPAPRPTVVTPTPTGAPKPPGEQKEVIVYITRSGTKYHRAGCRHLRNSMIPISLKNAKAQGYTPCSVCKPPR